MKMYSEMMRSGNLKLFVVLSVITGSLCQLPDFRKVKITRNFSSEIEERFIEPETEDVKSIVRKDYSSHVDEINEPVGKKRQEITENNRITAEEEERLYMDWETFKMKFNKTYRNKVEEKKRYKIYQEKLAFMRTENELYKQGLKTHTLGVGPFADMTYEEFLAGSTGFIRNRRAFNREGNWHKPNFTTPLESTIDWRQKGIVTEVKNQGRTCQSCYAFAAAGAIEGQVALQTGQKAKSLSAQNLVDCSHRGEDNGCQGGDVPGAYEYVMMDSDGVDTDSSYPYIAEDEPCMYDPATVGGTISNFNKIKKGSEKDMQEAVARVGPVAACLNVSPNFQNYMGGVFTDNNCAPTPSNGHCLLIVGYGSENGKDYWIIKNQYGTGWGDRGYVKFRRNYNNMCDIADYSTYPVV